MKIKKSVLEQIIIEEINAVLAETERLSDLELKRRKRMRDKATRKRQDDRQRKERAIGGRGLFKGYDDASGGLKSLAHGIVEKEKKPSKPNCVAGNPFHNEDGEFADPTKDKGSWSIAVDGPHSADCQSGQARRPSANRKQVIVKRRCGRGPDGKGKAKWKCKDQTRSHTPSKEMNEEWLLMSPEDEEQELDEQGQQIDCSACWQRFLRALNAANLAAKGDLLKK